MIERIKRAIAALDKEVAAAAATVTDEETFIGVKRMAIIENIRLSRYALQDLRDRYEETLWALQKKIENSCDHRYPDGKSAWDGNFMMNECKICGANDL